MPDSLVRFLIALVLIAALGPDTVHGDTARAIAAFDRKDYVTAWREFMASAKQGDAEAQAGVGAMLFTKINPPGTGFYADCEQWLKASADRAAARGDRYARMEAKGMRLQGESNRVAAMIHANRSTEDEACFTAGGVPTPGACLRGGATIDPYNPYANK